MTIAERLEQKGEIKKAREIARQLQKMGMTPEQVKQATRISEDELQKITY